uniref:Mediator of RNA polymerase II transcription subunit 26 n=1 Tax=Ditylenchus dipsaci TaxID=166011 RepID=A0A915DEC7_9BILA
MVACADSTAVAAIQLLVLQPVGVGNCMQQNPSCAVVVDQIKHQLQLVTENEDYERRALDAICRLENLALTKEVLEATRIGATVNEVRKQSAGKWPEVSKKCRALIKSWQKIAEFHRPISSCEGSSNGGTPNLVSPALRRGVTPRTPGKTRITSTDSNSRGPISRLSAQDGSVQNGSYAPFQKGKSISPYSAQVHKSVSVGGALCSLKSSPPADVVSAHSDEFSRDSLPSGTDAASFAAEKRKATDEPISISAALKRSKSSGVKLGAPSTTSFMAGSTTTLSSSSVVAARKDVQSTAELLAQLSENLPQSMAKDLIKGHEASADHPIPRERSLPYALETMSKVSPPIEFTAGKLKRKYTKRAAKFFRNSSDAQLASMDEQDEEVAAVPEQARPTTNGYLHKIEEEDDASTSRKHSQQSSSRGFKAESDRQSCYNWYSKMPSLKSLENATSEYAQPRADLTASVVIPIRQRQVLLLPYVDIGLPDFVEYNFPEPEQYLAKQSNSSTVDFSKLQINKKY